ncbi:FAD-binding oxidoreductase [Acinetobacter sp. ESL0695]|uniref:NAD(P)/FAD-dependent oxidoreductase n=1 Tax=Acinetobacter sp. ESL0695 TaxID=2983215 RepID=UPI0023F0CFF3|nr:FAD-binding oxidoreductase [Acinetobacter sp. ESL0695]WEV48997.1 FAD-binding oxidoreductase [Acinetobacter sp. ESL0695]
MRPAISSVETSSNLPSSTTVIIIGGGIVGLTAALTLAERKIPVVVLEKGQIAGEQSSRNLGWIRKTSRTSEDVPLAQASDRLWKEMSRRVQGDVGYRQSGIMFVTRTQEQMASYEKWYESVRHLDLDTQILSNHQISSLAPQGKTKWEGGVYTPSDGCAEPTLAASAIAKAAIEKGAIIIESCAVRTLSLSAGRVSGVVTEQGEIRCEQVLLTGGLWSRKFLGNLDINFPTLPLICSVLHTKPMQGPTDISLGAPDFSFRRHQDGGFIITQRGALDAPMTLDHLLIGMRYLNQLRAQGGFLRVSLGKYGLTDLALSRRWKRDHISPFEKIRIMDPQANIRLNKEAINNLQHAWPMFSALKIANAWAGVIDVTPDSNPIIGSIDKIHGLFVASGFSGHGFGTSPAAGQLAADLIMGNTPIIDPTPYSFRRFQ